MPAEKNEVGRNWNLTPIFSDPAFSAAHEVRQAVVLDTNIVLDLFVFGDAAAAPLRTALETRQTQWLATSAMREELVRVLAYPQIVKSMSHHGRAAAGVLAAFDMQAQLVEPASKAGVTCKDADDQKFIDLAVAHQATLLSKDHAVLCMKKRLAALGVQVAAVFTPSV